MSKFNIDILLADINEKLVQHKATVAEPQTPKEKLLGVIMHTTVRQELRYRLG